MKNQTPSDHPNANDQSSGTPTRPHPTQPPRGRLKRAIKKAAEAPVRPHPGLIPGIGVEQTGVRFPTNRAVLTGATAVTLGVIAWAFISPDSLASTGSVSLA